MKIKEIVIFKNKISILMHMAIKNMPALAKILDITYTMLLVILISVIVGLILAFPVQWLWNFVFGKIYPITVFQAWGLNVLASILFGKGGDRK
jgi:hypothetical protein